MKKQTVTILGMLAGLAVLGAGMYFLRQPAEDQDAALQPAAEASDVIFDLRDEEKNGLLTQIRVKNSSGGFSAARTEEGWMIESLEDVPLDASVLHSLISSVTSLKSVQDIEGGEEHLSDYGLTEDRASAVVEADLSEDNVIHLIVGDEVPGSEGKSRYVEADGKVRTAYRTKVDVFLNSVTDFVEKEITPSYKSSAETFTLESVTVKGSFVSGESSRNTSETEKAAAAGKTQMQGDGASAVLEVKLADSAELAGIAFHTYELSSPWQLPADTSEMESWFPSFFNLKAEDVEELFPKEEDRKEYGLDDPWAEAWICYRDNEGEEQAFSFSLSRPDENGAAFAAVPGRDVIYRVNVKDVEWVRKDPKDLVSRQLISPSVLTLSSLQFLEEGKDPMEILLTQDTANNATEARIGEQLLADKSFRNFYYTLISLTADEVILEEEKTPEGYPEIMEITFTYLDEARSPEVLLFCRETDRVCLAFLNGGERVFRVSEAKLAQVTEALRKLAAGEEVPARY